MDWLKNKTVLITGASDGIGREMSKRLSTVCSELILVASNRSGKLETLYEELKSSQCNIKCFTADVRDYDACKSIINSCNKIDSFIYCAGGTAKYGLIESFDKDEIQSIFDVNIVSLCQWLSVLLPKMKTNTSEYDKKGHIILLSSRSGERAMANLSVYAAAKGAVERLCEGLQRECARNGLVFTLINPGSINTSFTSQWSDSRAVLEQYHRYIQQHRHTD